MFLKILMIISITIIFCFFAKKASGTLSISKMNIVSCIFYLFILQTFIGGSLIFIGFDKDYLIDKVMQRDITLNKTYSIIVYTVIALFLTMYLVSKIMRINVQKQYSKYLEDDTVVDNEKILIYCVTGVCLITFLSTVYMYVKIGYLPFLKLLTHVSSSKIPKLRYQITSNFKGNQYIKNILALGLTPVISYLTYILCRKSKNIYWKFLFVFMFCMSILNATYNFAKSPILFYLIGFVVIEIIINNGIKLKYVVYSGILLSLIIVFMYIKTSSYDFSNGFDIYNGPIGRIIFTQVGTLYLHVDMFPNFVPYLKGASLYPTILNFLHLGVNPIRSGLAVMEFYNTPGIYNQVAGVMNTIFVGEAYANFGMIGVIIAPIYVGALVEIIYLFIIKSKKDPVNITILVYLTINFSQFTQGGFCDFIYNANIIITVFVLLLIKFVVNKGDKIKLKLLDSFKTEVKK